VDGSGGDHPLRLLGDPAGFGEVALSIGQLAFLAGEDAILLRLRRGVLSTSGVQFHLQLLDHVLPGHELGLEALSLLGVDALLESALPPVEEPCHELTRVQRHCRQVPPRTRDSGVEDARRYLSHRRGDGQLGDGRVLVRIDLLLGLVLQAGVRDRRHAVVFDQARLPHR